MILPIPTPHFTPTAFRANSSAVFNAVQSEGLVIIESKSRPDMVLMLGSEYEATLEKIRQLTEAVKKLDGDAHKQKDLLK